MIHSARPTVSPVENIVFLWNLFRFEKSGDGRTYEGTTYAETIITTGSNCGSA